MQDQLGQVNPLYTISHILFTAPIFPEFALLSLSVLSLNKGKRLISFSSPMLPHPLLLYLSTYAYVYLCSNLSPFFRH